MAAAKRHPARVVLRCDSGSKVGMGHWARCRALASWFDAEDVLLVVGVNEPGCVPDDGNVRRIPLDLAEADERGWWREQRIEADAIVFDLSHAARLAHRSAVRELLGDIGGGGARRIAIDGIGVQTLVDNAGWPVDAIILPYAGARESRFAPQTLAGPRYFIVPRGWGSSPARDTDQPVRCLLVTMGGSDPQRLTARALDAIERVAGPDWTIRVVIGPAFASDLTEAIRVRSQSDPRIEPIEAPPSLASEMASADLAIASTGLTKYELAWAGVPSLQISIDRIHADLNADFELEGTAIHLGAADEVDAATIAGALAALASDTPRRAAMGRRGRALVDGNGGARVAQVIRELIDARA